jgi:hypothetical protein
MRQLIGMRNGTPGEIKESRNRFCFEREGCGVNLI